jgi:N-acetylmuramoyl-L-alanine amidase
MGSYISLFSMGRKQMESLTPEEIKKRVFLDPGHSRSHPGATSRNGLVHEESLNLEQANFISDWLTKVGIEAVVFEPEDNLPISEMRQNAHQFYTFISLHHNYADCDGDPGTEVFINPRFKDISRDLAELVLDAVCATIGSTNRGVKQLQLQVLDMAEGSFDGPCILVESYFITNYVDPKEARQKSLVAAEAIAQTIADYLNEGVTNV